VRNPTATAWAGEKRIEVVVRELDAGKHQEVVLRAGARGFGLDLREIRVVGRRDDAPRRRMRRQQWFAGVVVSGSRVARA
jgi:hypothetical protein